MIYKLTRFNKKRDVEDVTYYKHKTDIVSYFNEVFPYSLINHFPINEDIVVRNSNGLLRFVFVIEEIKPNRFSKEAIPKAWDGDFAKHTIFEVFPVEHSDEIETQFYLFIEGVEAEEEYVDSLRIGKLDDRESMDAYGELVTCCGSIDREVTINNVVYVFGCNFGH